MIKEQLEEVRKNIEAACKRAGRDPKEVTLIAVSKTKPVPMLEEAYEAGARDFGENKVQEIVQKKPELPEDIRWHMIGHLQRNKVHQLMTIAPFVENPEENREVFKKLYEFAVDIGKKNIDNVTMDVLSMGMTGDYQVAIEEGATMVRVGTGIFGARLYGAAQ